MQVIDLMMLKVIRCDSILRAVIRMKSVQYMLFRIFPRFLFCATVFCFLLIQAASAQQAVELDGKSYISDQIASAFLSAAITKDLLNDYEGQIIFGRIWYDNQKSDPYLDFFSKKSMTQNYPWLAPHIYPEKLPQILRVNKWVKPITISFGMPNDLHSFSQDDSDMAYRLWLPDASREKYAEFFKNEKFIPIERNIKDMVKNLEALTKLNITYVAPEAEKKENYSNIRINLVFEERINADNAYKFKNMGVYSTSWGASKPISFRDVNVEGHIKTGFVFTARSNRQVDGYFLVNADNEIQMSVCYVWIGHTIEIINALINECLIRSLGFPGMLGAELSAVKNVQSYLQSWNEGIISPNNVLGELSEFDRHMIKKLYEPSIMPGMDYVQMLNYFSNN